MVRYLLTRTICGGKYNQPQTVYEFETVGVYKKYSDVVINSRKDIIKLIDNETERLFGKEIDNDKTKKLVEEFKSHIYTTSLDLELTDIEKIDGLKKCKNIPIFLTTATYKDDKETYRVIYHHIRIK